MSLKRSACSCVTSEEEEFFFCIILPSDGPGWRTIKIQSRDVSKADELKTLWGYMSDILEHPYEFASTRYPDVSWRTPLGLLLRTREANCNVCVSFFNFEEPPKSARAKSELAAIVLRRLPLKSLGPFFVREASRNKTHSKRAGVINGAKKARKRKAAETPARNTKPRL